MYLKTILRIILVSAGVALCGCGDFESTESEVIPSSVNVVFAVGNTPRTRTEYDVETKRFVWNDGDKIAVWAKSPDGSYALDNQAFRLMAVALTSPRPISRPPFSPRWLKEHIHTT